MGFRVPFMVILPAYKGPQLECGGDVQDEEMLSTVDVDDSM